MTRRLQRPILPLRQTIRVRMDRSGSGASGSGSESGGFGWPPAGVRLAARLTAVVDPGDGEQYDREDSKRAEEAPGIGRSSDQQQYDERYKADAQAEADELRVEAE